MAKAIYMGIGGVARKVKQPYIGVGNVARKVKTGYVGINGVARQFHQSGYTWKKYNINAPIANGNYGGSSGDYAIFYAPSDRGITLIKSPNPPYYIFAKVTDNGNSNNTRIYIAPGQSYTVSLEYNVYYYFTDFYCSWEYGITWKPVGPLDDLCFVYWTFMSSYMGMSGPWFLGYRLIASSISAGEYICDVTADAINEYPDNGVHYDGYWYIKQ